MLNTHAHVKCIYPQALFCRKEVHSKACTAKNMHDRKLKVRAGIWLTDPHWKPLTGKMRPASRKIMTAVFHRQIRSFY